MLAVRMGGARSLARHLSPAGPCSLASSLCGRLSSASRDKGMDSHPGRMGPRAVSSQLGPRPARLWAFCLSPPGAAPVLRVAVGQAPRWWLETH